jgi:hypothetical protein
MSFLKTSARSDLPIVIRGFGSLGPGTGGKEKRFMKGKTKYTDERLGPVRVVDDFLPPPAELVFKEEQVKVTISLSKSSVRFFKTEAKKRHTQYQKMIRRLLDVYADRFRR